jgi:AraC-like DNA-binding protein
MIDNNIEYKTTQPDPSLSGVVESFWMLVNHSEDGKEIVVLPDGRVDISFSFSLNAPVRATLLGVESHANRAVLAPKTSLFAVSLKLLAIEYLLDMPISNLVNTAQSLPPDFWGVTPDDLNDFDVFCFHVSNKIKALLNENIDTRKQQLFDYIYSSNGSMTVKELSEKVFWSSRQINRYFTQQFGISLKTYCTILRFRASFSHLKEGKLFPEQNFADQAHFIKEVKKLSGVIPKELFKNQNDRFIQFSTLPKG